MGDGTIGLGHCRRYHSGCETSEQPESSEDVPDEFEARTAVYQANSDRLEALQDISPEVFQFPLPAARSS